MIFTKRAHQSPKFQKNIDCSGEISTNLYFDRLLFLKVYKISPKKVQRSYVSWYWRLMQNLKKNRSVVSKMTRIWWILIGALNVSKICTLIALFCSKYITYDLKSYWGVTFHDTEESCKILRKTCLWFEKWHKEFDKFSPEHLKILKICTLMSYFWPKYKIFEPKKYRGFMFDGTEYWCKIWRKTNLCFQKWHEEFGKF